MQVRDVRTNQIDARLRARGYRLTPRRLMVVEVLAHSHGHLTGDDILCAVRERFPVANKTTVYRTLDLLSALGMVAVTDLGTGRLEYELAERPHHHLICERCRARIEVDDDLLEPLRARLYGRYGFVANLEHFALFGVCPDCALATP